ncbi:hypothetical protein BDZ91DRAFT_731406, partial [Kalaharituber pfeilii]
MQFLNQRERRLSLLKCPLDMMFKMIFNMLFNNLAREKPYRRIISFTFVIPLGSKLNPKPVSSRRPISMLWVFSATLCLFYEPDYLLCSL